MNRIVAVVYTFITGSLGAGGKRDEFVAVVEMHQRDCPESDKNVNYLLGVSWTKVLGPRVYSRFRLRQPRRPRRLQLRRHLG